jgi:hypothetical protein
MSNIKIKIFAEEQKQNLPPAECSKGESKRHSSYREMELEGNPEMKGRRVRKE